MTDHHHPPNPAAAQNPERRNEHVAIEIQPSNDNLVSSIMRQMETVSSLHSICRVTPTLRASSKRSYVPEKVSIGPYHHHHAAAGDESLKAMEDHKWRYVHALLNRKPNLEASLDECVSALKELEQRSRSCYEDDVGLSSEEFVKVMFLDGCFIIELLLKYSNKTLRRRNDPIFSVPGTLFDLRCDLILLENQIPLFVLQRLFQLVPVPKQSTTVSLPELAFRFFRNMIPGDPLSHREKFNQEGNHLLDLICHCLLPTLPRLPHSNKSHNNHHLRPASDLHSSGIRIKRSKTSNILDIKFANGILQIPQIQLHQYTESLFRNLIALERCSNVHGTVHHVTSYVVLMGSLIRSERDVKLLRQREILMSTYDGGGGEVGKLFEKLCEEVDLKESYYDGVCEVVNGYQGKNLRALKKKLKRGNVRRRRRRLTLKWVLLVGVLVLLIALVGTLFSVLTFVHHKV